MSHNLSMEISLYCFLKINLYYYSLKIPKYILVIIFLREMGNQKQELCKSKHACLTFLFPDNCVWMLSKRNIYSKMFIHELPYIVSNGSLNRFFK